MNKILAFLIAFMAISATNAQCPWNMVIRAGWAARPANTGVLPIRPAPFVVIHHTAGAACTNQATCAAQMRVAQNWHMDNNGWADIGYQFCVGGDGVVYEGRGWGRIGVHSPSYNNQSVGICFIGNFMTTLPPLSARNAAQELIRCGVEQGHISPSYWLIGHRQDNPTACPGDSLFNEIRNWPRWNSAPRPV